MDERARSNGHGKIYWVWVILVASVLLFATIIFFQTREIIINKPIMSEGVALMPVRDSECGLHRS